MSTPHQSVVNSVPDVLFHDVEVESVLRSSFRQVRLAMPKARHE